jgi:A/G-specific adenine glycosylase
MLHKAAQTVALEHNGNMPQKAIELRALPGIGAYTAAAIASIAHGEAIAVVDGNVERVLCRLEGWDGSAKTSSVLRKQIEGQAARLLDPAHPGDFNQALMELGATVCLPRNPQCMGCPLANHCETRGEHKTAPRKAMRSVDVGHALVVRTVWTGAESQTDQVLLERRPSAMTVMPGLWELPGLRQAEVPDAELRMIVRHAIMQVNYSVRIRSVLERNLELLTEGRGDRRWVALEEVAAMPLTGLARKVLKRAKLLASAPRMATPSA